MIRFILRAAIAAIVAGIALVLGLLGKSLQTGRIDPLDWLLAGTGGIIFLTILQWRWLSARPVQSGEQGGTGRRSSWVAGTASWALVAVPALMLLGNASGGVPWVGVSLLVMLLAVVAGICTWSGRWSLTWRLVAMGLCLLFAALTPALSGGVSSYAVTAAPQNRSSVAVLTALPLQGVTLGASRGLAPAEAVGLRSPLWALLENQLDLTAVDALDPLQLGGFDLLLLAQPRLLLPEELVALDDWVRKGGRAVILADPLLHWPDTRPLADPSRAPLTSLLDPLLKHWGLGLESAELEVGGNGHGHGSETPDRWMLESGAMLQLAGASRFTGLQNSSCALAEEGLVARCTLGEGSALLVADADWIDDMLWTMAPEAPADQRYWTSDAPDVLAAWLLDRKQYGSIWTAWLTDRASLVHAVRASLLLILLLSLGWAAVVGFPRFSHPLSAENHGQNKYKITTKGDSF